MKSSAALLIAVSLLAGISGCKTFRTERVREDCEAFRGIPTQVYKTHMVTVRWMLGPSTQQKDEINEGGTMTGTQLGEPSVQLVSSQDPESGKATVYTSKHFCRIPVTYAVDPIGTPFGTDEASLTLNGDGSLNLASQKRDHQVDELITAVGDAIPKLSPSTEAAFDDSNNPYGFFPKLPDGAVILEIVEIGELE